MGSLKEREKGILKISQRVDLNLRHLREDHTDDHYISPLLKADLPYLPFTTSLDKEFQCWA